MAGNPAPAETRKTAEEYYRSGGFYCSEAISFTGEVAEETAKIILREIRSDRGRSAGP
jgi:hypothetical protein